MVATSDATTHAATQVTVQANHQLHLARAWHLRGNLDRAIVGYRTVIGLCPDNRQAYELLAALFSVNDRLTEALEVYQQALQQFPEDNGFHKHHTDLLIELNGLDATFAHHGLQAVSQAPRHLTPDAILCCLVMRNEYQRLPYLLTYYRRLGVDQFLVVDNGSTDGSVAYLLEQPDVALWQSQQSFCQANFGSVWFDLLLRRYGVGHWCLTIDADELLYYANCETRSLRELCADLDREYKRAFTAILIDMYSDRPIAETHYQPGQDFLEVCPYFDRQVYHRQVQPESPSQSQAIYIGGMRERVFGASGNYCLNKVPLIKFLPDMTLAGGQHFTSVTAEQIAAETGVVLHFKYFASFIDYANQEAQRQEHSDQAFQYRQYADRLNQVESLTLYEPEVSVQFTNSQQLIELGILQVHRSPIITPWSGSSHPQPPHILFYSDCYSVYGASQWSHAMMLMLKQQGYRVSSVQYEVRDWLIQAQEDAGIHHYWLQPDNAYNRINHPRMFYNWAEPYQLFRRSRPDLIVFANGGPTSCLTAMEVAKDLGIPYIPVVHCVTPDWARQFATYLDRLPAVYEQAAEIVLVSQDNLDLMHQYFGLDKTLGRVIYNGRPDRYFQSRDPHTRSRLRQSLHIPDDGILCFTAGRLDSCKGYQYQIMAMQQLQSESQSESQSELQSESSGQSATILSRLHFVWAGTGEVADRLKKMVADLGMSDRVHFLGERTDIPDWLDAADIFILPSQFEGMPLAIMEAMAKGVPVIASAVSGIPEELGDTGALLPDPKLDAQATIAALATTLSNWASQPEQLPILGQAGRERAIALFQEQMMLKQYETLIQQVLAQNRRLMSQEES